MAQQPGRVVVFGPTPVLSVTVEARPDGHSDEIHVHAGGQGVWVARMAAELGARTVLCCLLGGEAGAVLAPLLTAARYATRVVPAAGGSGSYVVDRRGGGREVVATAWADPPSRHEVDDLVGRTCAEALAADVLVVCNPLPGDALPLAAYRELVTDVRAAGTRVVVDLSTPRLDAALAGGPDLVKVNDWELAEYVVGPVASPQQRRAAVDRLLAAGAGSVVVTRGGEPAYAREAGGPELEIVPPRFAAGAAPGCGDAMTGAVAAGWAGGGGWLDALVLGAAAGAANFLRHGLGSGQRVVVEDLLARVRVHDAQPTGANGGSMS